MQKTNIYINRLLATILLISLSSFGASAQSYRGNIIFTANLNGSQEPSAVNTNSVGTIGFMLNATMDTMIVTGSLNDTSSGISKVYVMEGGMGQTGSTLLQLSTFQNGHFIYQRITKPALSNTLLMDMWRGNAYVNVITNKHNTGEIRGQIRPEKDWSFYAQMLGANQVPPVTSGGMGLCVVSVSQDSTHMRIQTVFDKLSSTVTGIHLHWGAPGHNGKIALDLGPYLSGNKLSANISMKNWPMHLMDSLAAGHVYINVHTAKDTSGEIRGQLMMSRGMAFSAWMDVKQEPSANNSLAYGLAYLEAMPGTDSLMYMAIGSQLSSNVTGAHIHMGMPGQNGNIITGLNNVNNILLGTATDATVMTAIQHMLMGDAYVNIHTSNNPNGEIRGQVTSYTRKGFVFGLCPGQEADPVTSTGYGVGIVTVASDSSNLHYVYGSDSLTGGFPTGAGLYLGQPDKIGGSIYAFGGGATGYGSSGFWSDTMMTGGFNDSLANQVLMGNTYLNIMTPDNVGGEVRGQVSGSNMTCSYLYSGIANAHAPAVNLYAYPSPFDDHITLSVQTAAHEQMNVRIMDMQGRVVYESSFTVQEGLNSHTIASENMAKGIYQISVTNKNGLIASRKLVKY